jgi:hypothetical protein
VSERPDQEQHEELPQDLDPKQEADEVRGGTTSTQSNLMKTKDDTAKASINNLRG